jgi:hypothetical protein
MGQLARSEASRFLALGYQQFRSLQKNEWFDENRLQQLGAQEVVSFKSEYPPSAEQLQNRLKGNMDVYGASDAALLQLSGPLKGVVGLNLAPGNVMFRPGALFLAIGLPKSFERLVGGVSPRDARRVAVYSAFQDLQDPVTLFADEETFDLSCGNNWVLRWATMCPGGRHPASKPLRCLCTPHLGGFADLAAAHETITPS